MAIPGGLVVGLLAVGLLWGGGVEPRLLLDVRDTEATMEGLPSSWEGARVALLGDLQVGMWLDNDGMVRRAVRAIQAARPDLVLIAGDFVYEPDSAVVREAVELVRPLVEAGLPTFAVLGNHDYALARDDGEPDHVIAAHLQEELEAAGIVVLENESVRLEKAGRALHLVGVGSAWAVRSRPEAALAGVPPDAPRLVLMHNAVAFRELPPHTAPVVLAAHTHGGQIRFPFLPSESWLDIARPREVIADGWAVDSVGAPGNRAYVNRGIGFSVVPLRLFCRPELTIVTLRKGDASPDHGSDGAP